MVVLAMGVEKLTFDCRKTRGEGRIFATVKGHGRLLSVDEKAAMEGRGHGPAEKKI